MTSESEFWGPKTNIEEMQMVGIQVAKPSDIESTTMSKVTWRLVPFLMLCYFIAYLDRVNIGFAGATMRADLNLSATAFGGAAGIFFLAYFFFEVPSNLALNAFGARRWIARIMFTWGSFPAHRHSFREN
jgi:sugar phosphate permease